jgi:membrane protease YdiL (CAAX protease family)
MRIPATYWIEHPIMNPRTTPAALPYAQGLRARPAARIAGWRSVLAIVAGLAALAVVLFVLVAPLGRLVDRLVGAEPFDPAAPAVTVGYWLVGNLLLAALVPVSGLLQWAVHGVRPRWLSSVEGRFRWRWFGRAAAYLVPFWVVYMVLLWQALPTGPVVVSAETVLLVLLAVVTVPLQSAGEEYLFRGLITRAVGAGFARTALAVLVSTAVSAVMFTAIHGSLDPFALVYYLAASVGFSAAAHVSGGLEAGVLVHGVGNTLLFVPTVLMGGLGSIAVPTGPVLIVPTLVMLAFPLAVRWLAARYGVVTTAGAPRG